MKPTIFVCLDSGVGWRVLVDPESGASAGEVVEQRRATAKSFSTLSRLMTGWFLPCSLNQRRALPPNSKKTTEPPEIKIAIGDTISVLIWESAAGGLFSEAPPTPSSFGFGTGVEPFAPESRPPESETPGETRAPGLSGRPRDEAAGRPRSRQPSGGQPREDSRSRAPGRPAGVRPPEYPINRSVPMGRSGPLCRPHSCRRAFTGRASGHDRGAARREGAATASAGHHREKRRQCGHRHG